MAPVYDQNEALNTLWNEIMSVHWKFLDADESMEKIELRKRLEGKCVCNYSKSCDLSTEDDLVPIYSLSVHVCCDKKNNNENTHILLCH